KRVLPLDIGRFQLRRAYVHAKEDGAVLGPDVDPDPGGPLQAIDVLRRHVLHQIDFPRQKGGNARSAAFDGQIGDLLDTQRELSAAPIVLMALQLGLYVLFPRYEPVGARTIAVAYRIVVLLVLVVLYRDGVVGLTPRFAHDVDVGERRRQNRIG